MKINEVFTKKLRHSKDGANVVADVTTVVSANVDERSTHSRVSSRQRPRIVQRGGRSDANEDGTESQPPSISPNLAAPINAAVAFNVDSDDSAAAGRAEQDVEFDVDSNSEAQS
ncbi:MAG: hypothetical protein M3277_06090 [Actinomycetota bacterium]|nr:hypothetical protein [Actinomycetota bacterium]